MTGTPDYAAIDEGFSAKAAEYDALEQTHPVIMWQRRRIRRLVEREVRPGGAILELNAGSGLDAAYFAGRGYRVHATDVAAGMLEAAALKAAAPELGGRMTVELRSFTDLTGVPGGPFDLAFSNLGGLNCVRDLTEVAREVTKVLRPGGSIVWVIMPPLCPWEILQALRGHFATARRRLSPGGTIANVEGARVPVWYHTPGNVREALGPAFNIVEVRSFSLFAPPSYYAGFVQRHPRLSRALMRIDDRLGAWWAFNRAGDFFALVAQYAG